LLLALDIAVQIDERLQRSIPVPPEVFTPGVECALLGLGRGRDAAREKENDKE
jgi:hypothetical protein